MALAAVCNDTMTGWGRGGEVAATDDWTGGLGWAGLGCILSAAIVTTAWVSAGHRTILG